MPDEVRIGAHRGAMCHAPENTLPAFEVAIEHGTYRIECDVRRTADEALILIHDATVERTTNGEGSVRDKSLNEIKSLRAQGDVQIPTFAEALECAKGRARMLVELKDDDIVDQVVEEIVAAGMESECTVIAFHGDSILRARALNPDIARGYFFLEPGDVNLPKIIEDFAPALLVVWPRAATPEIISEAKSLGLQVRCGFADNMTYEESFEIFKRMVVMGVDEVSCGRPDWIKQMIESYR